MGSRKTTANGSSCRWSSTGQRKPRGHGDAKNEAAEKTAWIADAVGNPNSDHEEHEGQREDGIINLTSPLGGICKPAKKFSSKSQGKHGRR